MDILLQMVVNAMMSWAAFYATLKAIPQARPVFIRANLFGIDLCKPDKEKKVAESQGVIAGCVYLVVMFLFIPVPFAASSQPLGHEWLFTLEDFRHEVFAQFICALLSICCMIFLGFADDVLDLRWRTKLLLPTIATLPLLMVYGVTYNNTTVVVPNPLRHLLGYSLWLGPLYYLYLGMLAVFCTNAINIVAGINGIEAGQGLVIALSIIAYNVVEFVASDQWQCHLFSLHFMVPFVAVTAALLRHNWYPARVFVGDTYCYFAGMTFAVVGILGHFSKTMLLFFMPQVFNFLYSCPQLFHFVDCPRHRLPKYDPKTDKVFASTFRLKRSETKRLGRLFLDILRALRLVQYKQVSDDPSNDTYECSNLTIINLILVKLGPMNEMHVTCVLLALQVLSSCFGFFIRYGISKIFY